MYRKNVASQFIYFCMVTTAGVADTAATVTCKRCIDGGAQATAGGTTTHRGSGQYEFALTQADTNGNNISFLFTATGDVPVEKTIVTTAADPTDTVRFGLTALPNAVAGASGGVLISGSNAGTTTLGALTCTGTFTVSDGIVVTRSSANTSAITATGNGTGHGATLTSGSGASGDGLRVSAGSTNGQGMNVVGAGLGHGLAITAGATAHAILLAGGATNGSGLVIGTSSGDAVILAPTAGNGLTATANGASKHGAVLTGGTSGTSDGLKCVAGAGGVPIRGDLTSNITGNLSGSVGSVTGAVGSVTGNVGGNVVGSVGSVVGAVGSVTGAVGSVTGNVGGNVVGSVGSVVGAVGSVTAAVTVGTNNDKTGYALTSGERTSIADAHLDRDLSVGTDSGSPTVRTPRQALRFLRNKWGISGGTLTVTKEDDTNASWTAAVTTTAGNPVSQIDPA